MAKFSLQEMYLTEYNRLIAALQSYFTAGTSFTTIEQWADYLNSVKSSKEIKKIDLNNITFLSDITGATTEYVQGSQAIELTKHNNLITNNIKQGVTIEGITGTLVDGSTIVKLSEIQDVLDSKILSSLEAGYYYWYYDDSAKQLKKGVGKAQPTQNNKELVLGTDLLYTSGIFRLSESYANIPLKNLTIRPNNIITDIDTNEEGNYVVPVGYVPDTLTLARLSKSEREFLQDHLEHNQTILGVTGTNSSVVDTTEEGLSGSSSHIIDGEPYWRNGVRYTGLLKQLDKYSIIDSSHGKVENSIIPTVEENTALIIPANSYTHEEIKFDISQLKAENIKNGIDIMGIVGNADIVDLYEGPVSIPIGTTSPILLPDENGDFTVETDVIELNDKRLDSNIIFLPVANEYANDIVVGKVIGGLSGTFSSRSNSYLQYITEDFNEDGTVKEAETIIEANGSIVKHSESNDIAYNKFAFIDGRLCRGTNTSLINQEEYTGNYLLELADIELPTQLETKDKLLTDNIQIWINPDKINSDIIAYGSTVLGIPGQYTKQDTNPIANDKILHGYVGYANGQQYTGEIPNHGDRVYHSKLTSQDCNPGYYKTLTIQPIAFRKNSSNYYYEEGNPLIPSIIRKGWTIDGVAGTGLMLHEAYSPDDITTLIAEEHDDDVILYKGESSGEYTNNTYYEIIKNVEEYQHAGFSVPTADKLIRSRDLNEATDNAENILSGQIVYGNRGIKLTGTMANYGKYSYVVEPSVNYKTTKVTSGKGYYDGIELTVNTSAINASDIKHGVTLFGVEGTYTPSLETLSINGPTNDWSTDAEGYLTKTYTPGSGVDGWNRIEIKTLIRSKNLGSITGNGTHTFDVVNHDPGAHGWNQVSFTVDVAGPTLDTLNVTSNGTYNASDSGIDGWDTVTVDVHTVSGMPALPVVKDYNLYMDGDNISWLHNSNIIFDDNDDLMVYYTAISGNSNFSLFNIGDSIDMSNVKVNSVPLGTINLNPLFTNSNFSGSNQHVVAYFPAGKYCFPVWNDMPSIAAQMQEAAWDCNIFINGILYTGLTTFQKQNRLVQVKDSAGNRTIIFNFQETPQWKYSRLTITKPIMIPRDYYTTMCMRDLSLLFKPVKQEINLLKANFTSFQEIGYTTDSGTWYKSTTSIEVYNGSINASEGDYAVYSRLLDSSWGLFSGNEASMKITIDDTRYVIARINSSNGTVTMDGYSKDSNDSFDTMAGTLSIVTP